MSGFSAEWLALREPYDLAARNPVVLEAVAASFREQPALSIVDLACGTGASLRALRTHLPPRQSWRLVDNDLGLLAKASAAGRAPNVSVAGMPVDLVRDLELALDGPLHLVTTSALLDLVSLEWLDRLVTETAARRLPVYAALSYDGRVSAEPRAALDAEIVAGFNLHQHTDKGFGPALGPNAATSAATQFADLGYSVVQGRADWVLAPDDCAIQDAIFVGWAEVGRLTTGRSEREMAGWLAERRRYLAEGRSRLRIGHMDLFARPIGTR